MTSKASFRGGFTTYFQHGMLIIEDPESQAQHDGWGDVESLVSVERDSLYLGVIPSVDGPVEVSVYEETAPSEEIKDLELRFSGEIHTQHGTLRLRDPEDTICLEVQGARLTMSVRIYANSGDWIDRVIIVLV